MQEDVTSHLCYHLYHFLDHAENAVDSDDPHRAFRHRRHLKKARHIDETFVY